jgi:tRNA pseudouridine38-40 synthase
MRYFCRVSYDGTSFCGWQRQPEGGSVQQCLESAAATVLRRSVAITGAGRTDAGVHARAQGAHFDVDGCITDIGRFTRSVNGVLPPEVAVYRVTEVPSSFHARYSAVRRSYRYTICLRKSPLLLGRAWHVGYGIDWRKLADEVTALRGEHNFAAFCAAGSGCATAVCTVSSASIEPEGECMVFSIEANRFVYKMVRSIVGTLIDIGRGEIPMTLGMVIDSKDRSLAGVTAPPCGLVLDNVVYTEVE